MKVWKNFFSSTECAKRFRRSKTECPPNYFDIHRVLPILCTRHAQGVHRLSTGPRITGLVPRRRGSNVAGYPFHTAGIFPRRTLSVPGDRTGYQHDRATRPRRGVTDVSCQRRYGGSTPRPGFCPHPAAGSGGRAERSGRHDALQGRHRGCRGGPARQRLLPALPREHLRGHPGPLRPGRTRRRRHRCR